MLVRIAFFLLVAAVFTRAASAAPIQLPKTGQTLCWDDAGEVIDCAGTGMDGEASRGREWPTPRFNDNGDGTLTDLMTGLVWLRDTNCYGSLSWQVALDAAKALGDGSCGLSDGSTAGKWRLPNRRELLSITNQNVSDGGAWLTSQGFANAQHTYYWTSDTCLDYAVAYKWMVHSVGAAYPESWNGIAGTPRGVMLVRNPEQVTLTAAVAGGNGSIGSANPLTVAYGAAASFTLTPDAGYEVSPTVTGTCPARSFTGNVYDLGTATADCSVNFTFTPITYTIATSTTGSGSITCTPAGEVAADTAVSCTATPADGHHIATVEVDGAAETVADSTSFTYSFPAVTADHNVHVSFAINSYTVTFLHGSNGILTGSTSQTVNHGASAAAVTAVPSPGYHFVRWTGDHGFAATAANPLTLISVTQSQTVTASFAINSYVVTPGSAANGSITPAAPQAVDHNAQTSFTLAPDVGYRIASVTGCAGELLGSTYTTGAVTADCTVSFSFTPIIYTITASTSGSGSIACTPAGTVSYNGSASCTAVADAGSHLVEVTVDGVEEALTAGSSFTYPFSAVTGDHAIRAVFALNSYNVTFAAGINGTITGAANQSVDHGGSTAAVSAVGATGYHLLNWTGNNGFAATTQNPLTVSNVTASQAITANFGIDTHLVTPGAAANGSITPAVPQTVSYHGVSSFTVSPDAGYRIASVTGCGGTLNGSTYSTAPVKGDCSVVASFAAIVYAISSSADDKGEISCTPQVAHGGTANCSIIPRPGYRLAALSDNGSDRMSLASNNSYTITNVTGAHMVSAAFTANNYVIGEILKAFKSVVGLEQLSDAERGQFDVAPLGADGRPRPDGVIDVADIIILLRKLVRAVDW